MLSPKSQAKNFAPPLVCFKDAINNIGLLKQWNIECFPDILYIFSDGEIDHCEKTKIKD